MSLVPAEYIVPIADSYRNAKLHIFCRRFKLFHSINSVADHSADHGLPASVRNANDPARWVVEEDRRTVGALCSEDKLSDLVTMPS